MEPKFENRGGLIGQLYGSALDASDDGAWSQPIEQTVILSRSTTSSGEVNDFIRAELIAKKEMQNVGRTALKTFYSLKASYTERNLPIEFLPENVLEVLRRKKVTAGEEPYEVLAFNDDEIDEHEFDGYEDMVFRRVRSLEYVLDGRGSLLFSAREDVYEDDDEEGGVEIVKLRTEQLGSPQKEEMQTVSLQGWGKNAIDTYSTELLVHPDIQKLEIKTSLKELRADMMFLDIVENYRVDKKLLRHSQREQRRDMLALMAFLNRDASTKDILHLIYLQPTS